MIFSLHRGASLLPTRWKNGGGITREVAARAHAWRASIAEIERPGPFSRFVDVDRTLVMLDGRGLDLGLGAVMQAFDIARFDGAAAIEARTADGPVRVFNVMTHRGAAHASVAVSRATGRRVVEGDTVLLHCATRALGLRVAHHRITLAETDTVRIDAAEALEIEAGGDGVMVYASIAMEVLS